MSSFVAFIGYSCMSSIGLLAAHCINNKTGCRCYANTNQYFGRTFFHLCGFKKSKKTKSIPSNEQDFINMIAPRFLFSNIYIYIILFFPLY